MSKKNKNSALDAELDMDLIGSILQKIILVVILLGSVWIFFNVYDPKKQNFIKRSNFAYSEIEKVAIELHKEFGYVYPDMSASADPLCSAMLNKNSKKGGECEEITPSGTLKRNFTFDKTNIEIYGMEKAPTKVEGAIVKEIMIDTNGEAKGPNAIGEDKIPVRIYSSGMWAGRLSPINCSLTSLKDWEIYYSPICTGGPDVDYMQTNMPFGYDVTQIGGPEGKSTRINRNVPFLRADCAAFGGEYMAPLEYCDKRQYHWLPACYDEYPCSIDLAKSK